MDRSRPPVRLPDAFEGYKATYMASRNMARRARVEYARDVGDLIDFLRSNRIPEPRSVELRDLEHYLGERDRRGLSGSSRRRRAATMRSFFRCLRAGEGADGRAAPVECFIGARGLSNCDPTRAVRATNV